MPPLRALRRCTCVAASLLLLPAGTSTSAEDNPRWPLPAFTTGLVNRSLVLALGRLETPPCRALFDDFTDGDGRTLAAKLERLGDSPGQHLRRLRWLNGVHHPSCQDPKVLLVTYVGASFVYVCAKQFTAFAEKQPVKAAGLILHEQLHALGLRENPPSSEEISRQVWMRCGR